MNNILTHNNKSKQAHQIATKPLYRKGYYAPYLHGHLQEMPPTQIVQGAFIIISVRSTLENVLDTYLSSPARTDI